MKTKTTKKAIAATINQARELETQARKLREEHRKLRLRIHDEENAIIQEMVTAVQEAGCFMTASEIVQAIGGAMSVHEVAGQLTYARNSKDSQRKRQPYFGHAPYNMRHETMAEAAPLVDVEERKVTRRFVEVDEDGKVIQGGRTFKQTEARNIYRIDR